MLVRTTERRREMAIRQALGASRNQLARQLLLESALLASAGAALGVLLARWAVPLLVALSPATMPRAQEIQISLPVLVFTAVVAIVSALAFGLLPALRAARLDPNQDLKLESRGATGTREGRRLRGLSVATQVAVMVVLLTGAGLLLRSFRELMRVDPGFDQGVLTVRLSLPRASYGELGNVSRFYRELESRVAGLPGVVSVAAVNHVPLNGALASADYKVAGRPPVADDRLPTAQYRMVTPSYFRTMSIPVIAGRVFDEDDREGGARVAIVSQALARQSFPDRDPVGEHLLVEDSPEGFRTMEIVGVVGDVKHVSLEAEALPHLYVPYHQTHRELLVWLTLNQFLVVRTAGAPLLHAEAVRRALEAVDPNVAAAQVCASGDYVAAAAKSRRFSLLLLGIFAGVALLMAALGIYGVVSYAVAQRTRETGVRLALGAGMGDILALVLGEGVKRTLLGIAAGLLAALVLSRALRGLLYGVGAMDPYTYGGVIVVLVTVALMASFLPAWRAARLDPLAALRRE
jgi:putative ABC transport system permease protein